MLTFDEASQPLRWGRLVHRLARRLPRHMRDDAVQDGWVAVLLAIQTLDPKTYTGNAAGYMAQRIRWHHQRAPTATVYVPQHMREKVFTAWTWERDQNRPVTSTEIAEAVGLDPMLFAIAEASIVARCSHGRRNRDDGDGWVTLETLDEAPNPEDIAASAELKALTVRALAEAGLTARQRVTLQDGTLSAIGQDMGLSRERVRQIRRDAHHKLREWFSHHCPEVVVRDPRSSQGYLRLEREIYTMRRELAALPPYSQMIWGIRAHCRLKGETLIEACRQKAAIALQVQEPEAPPTWFSA